jgi:hypothetical protein
MPAVLEAVTSRIMSLLLEMKQGPEQHPSLGEKYNKAVQNLARETKNFRLDSPLAIASYNSRMLLENPVWHIEQYITEMEGEAADKNPLTMNECALLVEEALTGRVAVSFRRTYTLSMLFLLTFYVSFIMPTFRLTSSVWETSMKRMLTS